MTAPPTYQCPNCGGYVDNHGLRDEVVEKKDGNDAQVTSCDDCDFERVAVTWGGAGEREVWGETVVLADPYPDAPEDADVLVSYHDDPGDGTWKQFSDLRDETIEELLKKHRVN